MFKKLKNFVSELGKFLVIYDRRHGLSSPSQQAEIRKAQALAEKRDRKS